MIPVKMFICVWGDGFPNTYSDTISSEELDFFCEDKGYPQETIEKLKSLKIGESIGPDDHGIDGGHIITRIMDNFTLFSWRNPEKDRDIQDTFNEVTALDAHEMEGFLSNLSKYFKDHKEEISNMDCDAIAYNLMNASKLISERTSN